MMPPPRLRPSPVWRVAAFQQCRLQRPFSSFGLYRLESRASIDLQEVSHFNALASSWWDPHGPSRLLHLMNPLRHDFINLCRGSTSAPVTSEPHSLRYLDIGCGGGIFTESAARLPTTQSVTGIDPSPEPLAIAKAHARRDPYLMSPPGRLTYLNIGIEDLPVPKSPTEAYDIVSLFEVIEHVPNPSAFLTNILPHVKPGGWLVLSTISRTWTSWLVTKVIAEAPLVGVVPRGTHDWGKYIKEEEIRRWFLTRGGWHCPRVMGVVYVPGLGWREVQAAEKWGNYFFGIKKDEA